MIVSTGLKKVINPHPSIEYDFTSGTLPAAITLTRTGDNATYVDSNGFIATALSNVPRFTYNPATLLCKGLLLEVERENMVLQSENLKLSWTTTRSNVSTNPEDTAPDNVLSAYKLYDDNTAANGHLLTHPTFTTVSGQKYTYSIFVKKKEYSWICLYAASHGYGRYFNVETGQLGTYLGNPPITSVIEPYGNGYYRCSITYQASSTSDNWRIYLAEGDGDNTIDGDGVSGVYAWGGQAEKTPYRSSYIKTSGSKLSRYADSAAITGTNFSNFYNPSQGTWYIETEAVSGDVILTAGNLTISANATATKKYAASYTSDQSASSLVLGPGTVKTLRYYPHALPTAILNRLTA